MTERTQRATSRGEPELPRHCISASRPGMGSAVCAAGMGSAVCAAGMGLGSGCVNRGRSPRRSLGQFDVNAWIW